MMVGLVPDPDADSDSPNTEPLFMKPLKLWIFTDSEKIGGPLY